ncbi:MAG: META domain-containing protein [Chloroflexi bacterium]|nr:META domain-containing protein [Chloroflexota bacterium]
MRRPSIITLALLAGILAGGCSADTSADPGGSGAPGTSAAPRGSSGTETVEGRTFLSTEVEGQTLLAGTRIRLSFQGGTVGADAGCNSMGGSYQIQGDRLVVPQMITTEMGCALDRAAQDQWVAAILSGSAIALDGDALTLTGNGIRVTLLDRTVADPDRPLLGTPWTVDGIIQGDAASSVPLGATAVLTFSSGRVDVQAGCNAGSAEAVISNATITFGVLGLTKKICGSDVMELEQSVLLALNGVIGYRIEADALTLTNGAVGLTLRAAP